MCAEHIARQDYEYVRKGTVSGFMMASPPPRTPRGVCPDGRRTAKDYALAMRHLADEIHPGAEKVVVVQDNFNTHRAGSLYEAYDPQEAHRKKERFEFHYTPKHASWLNITECELSALSRQCLDRRIADLDTLQREVSTFRDHVSSSHKNIGPFQL